MYMLAHVPVCMDIHPDGFQKVNVLRVVNSFEDLLIFEKHNELGSNQRL